MPRAQSRTHLPALILAVGLCLSNAVSPRPLVNLQAAQKGGLERSLEQGLRPLLGSAAVPTAQLAISAWCNPQNRY